PSVLRLDASRAALGSASSASTLAARDNAAVTRLRRSATGSLRGGLGRGLGLDLFGAAVLGPEALDPAGGVHQAQLAREVRVALGADFQVDRLRRGPRDPAVAARADHRQGMIFGVNTGLH